MRLSFQYINSALALLLALMLCSCASKIARVSSSEESLGNASKLEFWWRPNPTPQFPEVHGSIIYRLFTEKKTLVCVYDYDWLAPHGSVPERIILRPDEIVARNIAMIEGEKKKGELHVVFEQRQELSHATSVMEPNECIEVILYFFGDGRRDLVDQPLPEKAVSIVDRPILAGYILSKNSIVKNTDTLVATVELNVPATARIVTWRKPR